jgi:hypothetical protein
MRFDPFRNPNKSATTGQSGIGRAYSLDYRMLMLLCCRKRSARAPPPEKNIERISSGIHFAFQYQFAIR